MRKSLKICFTALSLSLCIATSAFAGTWEQQDSLVWKYKNDDGTYAVGWLRDNNKDYYFDEKGIMQKYIFVDGNFLSSDGSSVGNYFDHTDIYDFVREIPDSAVKEKLHGVWNNELTVRKAAYKLQQVISGDTIRFHKNVQSIELDINNKETWYYASYSFGMGENIRLWSDKNRGSDNYQIDINALVNDPLDRFCLECLCLLIDDEVYEVVQRDYDEEFLQPDTWTTVGNYQYMVNIEVRDEFNAGCVRYYIKEK